MQNTEREWLQTFITFWSAPRANFELLRQLFAENINLIAPGLPTVRGMRRALMLFEQMLKQMPDLSATVHRTAFEGGVLFIEMTFSATVSEKPLQWDNVDRFILDNGKALERRAYFDPTPLQSALKP